MYSGIIKKKKQQRKCRPPGSKRRHFTKRDLARMHLTRRQHIAFLARPNFRRIQDYQMKRNVKIMPNWRGCYPLYPISCHALKATSSKRIVTLSGPKVSAIELESKRSLHDQMLMSKEARTAVLSQPPKHYVQTSALRAKVRKRVKYLSYPKMIYCLSQLEEFGALLGNDFQNKMTGYIKKSPHYIDKKKRKDRKYETFHIRSHKSLASITTVSTSTLLSSKSFKPKKYKPMSKEDSEKWLQRLAKPKKIHKPPPMPKTRSARLEELKPRIEVLSKPIRQFEKPDEEQYFKVKPSALTYHPTNRIKEIAAPRYYEVAEMPEVTEFGVNPMALKAIATPATIKLAKPIERKLSEKADYEYAFKVKPEALKAKCTKRLNKLARPIER